jgi:5-methylcytosine-specific restriction endonuclease McrA
MPNDLESRLLEIDNELQRMPVARAGDPLGAKKWMLYQERRKLRLKLSKLKGTHTFRDEVNLIQSVNGRCAICGSTRNPSIDHIIPISQGGSDSIENLRVLCGSCNSKKGGRYAQ